MGILFTISLGELHFCEYVSYGTIFELSCQSSRIEMQQYYCKMPHAIRSITIIIKKPALPSGSATLSHFQI